VVIAARFLVPLVIPKYPLPGILASIAVDAADQSILHVVLGTDLPAYQPFDKAFDVYSLSITMLTVLRNWQSRPAVEIARVLFYFRLLGVFSFELTGWRPLLLIFANTFEYFFIFYEVARAWWSPLRLGTGALLRAAVAIWIVIKLPQEYALHVARLDVSDVIRDGILRAPVTAGWAEAVAQLLSAAAAVVGVAVIGLAVRALAPPPQHPRRLAADPLPVSIDEAHEWARHVARRWRVLDRHLVEKIVLVGCLTVIFAQIVPGLNATVAQLVGGVAAVATLNSLLLLRRARKGRPVPPAVPSFLLLAGTNVAFVLAAHQLLRPHGSLSVPAAVFFLLLLTLIVTLYDRWHPVFDERFKETGAAQRTAPVS
jgi:hypothetical protein